jgi:glycosyltransferase 2 family protein
MPQPHSTRSRWKTLAITAAKVLLSAGIIACLVFDATRAKNGENVFARMWSQPKQWDLLAAAWLLAGSAVVLTFVRWYFLVRAMGIPFRLRDALRLGFLATLVNLAPMGIVGGDVLKALMLDRAHPGFRAKAVASVLIDRVVGLYVLFVVASVGIVATGYYRAVPDAAVHRICWITISLTLVGTAGVAVLLLTPLADHRWLTALERIPRVGPPLGQLLDALRMYRRNARVLLLAAGITVAVHCVASLAIYAIARGLPGEVLPLREHFVVYPISAVGGVVPLPAGPFEAVLDFLYSRTATIAAGQGLVVALVFRLINILIAAVGFCYYLGSRREVVEAMHASEAPATGGE